MGFFSSSKKISSEREIKKLLSKVGSLTGSERKAIQKKLAKYQGGGGLSKNELKRAVRDLKKNTSDSISSHEAKATRRRFLDHFSR